MAEPRVFLLDGRWYAIVSAASPVLRSFRRLPAREAELLCRSLLAQPRLRSQAVDALTRVRPASRVIARRGRELEAELLDAVRDRALHVYERLDAPPKVDPGVKIEPHVPPVQAPHQQNEIEDEGPTPILAFIAGVLDCGAMLSPREIEVDTPVIAPLPAGVVGRLFAWDQRPSPAALFKVKVFAATEDQVSLSCDAGGLELPLDGRSGDLGGRITQKWVLPWFGEAGDLGGAQWDDIELFEVSAGGSVPFATTIDATCGAGEGKLGLIDVILEDPDSGEGRSIRYGVFRTRTPTATFVLPQLNHPRLRIIVDDGYDDTDDELDITALVNASGDETSFEFPGWTDLVDGPCTGTVNEQRGRMRMVLEEPEQDELEGDCAVLLRGENRLRIFQDDQLVFCAHSLHYTEAEEVVASGHCPTEVVETEHGRVEIITGALALDFVDDTPDAKLSDFLHAARLRPCSWAARDKILEGRTHHAIPYPELLALIEHYRENEELLEDLGLAPWAPEDPDDIHTGILESLPAAINSSFSAAADTFNNAANHWHHYVIHTFPAHRLIEQLLFPRARPPVVSLSGVQFGTNKTFVNPGASDGIRRLVQLYQEDPARKLAIFGHTDRVGDDAYNEGLSLMRARSVNALLRNEAGFWFDRFQKPSESVGTARADQKWALTELGHYHGAIDDNPSPSFDAAVNEFQTARGIPVGPVTWQTRAELGTALREQIGAVNETLEFEDPWGTREYQHMLAFLGFYDGPTDGIWRASYHQAVRDFQTGHSLGVDGDIGIVTRILLIRDYQAQMVIEDIAPDRFHADAVFGCGEAFPKVPTADNVESQPNRRVEIVLRREPVEPIDPVAQRGATVPYPDWFAPELPTEDEAGDGPSVVVAIGDSGFGNAEDYRADLDARTRLLVTGSRFIRPTDVSGATAGNPNNHTVAATGDLRGLADSGIGHGTMVTTCMVSDGIGNPVGGAARTTATTVIGTAPHVKVRPIRKPNTLWCNLLCLEVVASDPDVKIYSTSSHLYRNTPTDRQRRALQERLQDMINQGKIVFASAGNYRDWLPGEYDTATREMGSQASDRRFSRSDPAYSGGEAHRASMSIVGSSAAVSAGGSITAPGQQDTVADHTYLGEQVGIHMPGEQIQVLTTTAAFGGTAANGLNVVAINGTSFATPMTAGVAGELMLVDPQLQDPANLPRVIEYIEATADPLPNVNPAGGDIDNTTGVLAPRNADPGAPAGVPPNGPEAPTAATTYQDIRRVHFWKAVLAAVNEGLAAEGRGNDGATDNFFQYCTLRGDASTNWYGFELRSPTPNTVVYWRTSDGEVIPAEDFAAHLPNNVTFANTWRTVDLPELAAGQPLPAFPWTRANFTAAGRTPYYLCQLSISKDDLARYTALLMYPPQVDPLDPAGPTGPAIVEIAVDDRNALRDPASLAGDPDLGKQAIATFVQFSDFIFRVTAVPEPVDHFVMIAEDHRTAAGLGEEIEVRLFAVDRFGFMANPGAAATNVTHDGTAGTNGPPLAGVFLNGSPTAPAGIVPTFGVGTDHPGLARIKFQGHTLETVNLRFDDGAGHTGTVAIEVRPAGPLSGFRLELRRPGGGASVVDSPVAVAEAFELEITAVDAGGVTVTSFNGQVTLSLLAGEMGSEGPPRRGLHVKAAEADPFDPAAFTITLANGTKTASLFCYTTGDLHLKVEDQNSNVGESRKIRIVAGALAQLRVQASTPQTRGNRFDVIVTALDASGNVLADYTGTVTLALAPGHGTAGALAGGAKTGMCVADSVAAGDDTLRFEPADEGSKAFMVCGYTAETVRFRATDAGAGISGDSSDVVIDGNAVDHFGFEFDGADRAEARFDLEVTARDADDNIVSDYTGNVTLSLAQGTAFAAGPPAAGVRFEAPGNVHAFVAGDHGRHRFQITPFTAETIQIRASDGAVTSDSDPVSIEAAAGDSLRVVAAVASVPRNTAFNVTVTAIDAEGNTVTGFTGPVTLQFTRNGGGRRDFAPAQRRTFTPADNGTGVFVVRFSRRGDYFVFADDGGDLRGNSARIRVT